MKKVSFTILTAFILLFATAVKVSAQTSRIQIIHNSPDYILDTVDVWANNTRIANDLVFRKATQMIAIDSGNYVITIAKKFSTDTTSLTSVLRVGSFRIDSGKTYLAFISGVVDTTQYATNPEGINRTLSWISSDTYKSSATNNRAALYFANGVPDAPKLDLNRMSGAIAKIGNDVAYGDRTDSVIVTLGNTVFNLTLADSSLILGAYKLNTSPFSGKTVVIFTSGVYAANGNPTPAKSMKLFAASSDGSVTELTQLMSELQIVHNSADTILRKVDVYINGVKTLSGLNFRTGTSFIPYKSLVPLSIGIAANGSNSVTDTFYSASLTPDSSTGYYLVLSGVRTPNSSNFNSNPNGRNISFKMFIYKGAKKTALYSKNIDLLYFQGVTDLQTTKIRGIGQIQFLSKGDSYGDFHGYGSHSALDNILFEISDNVADTLLTSAYGNLVSHQGKTGLVFASGFKTSTKFDSTSGSPSIPKQQLDSAKLMIIWPDGDVDTLTSKWSVGINEEIINESTLSVYPNPAGEELNISFDAKQPGNYNIDIKDITGKIIRVVNGKTQMGFNHIPMDISSLNSGLYIVNVISNQQVFSHKLNVIK